ncbi:MAG: class I SAM-dependent methyltransferase [Acidobacteria bacterium]|jgi:SAM-dependent methyltransferase|nr:class I SAM-dependent methyltransferase [Acidobacteriota bacterium]HEV8157779.1 class I SAM-dependent methyltransferase [Pyrinomonadaceae bacterium]
MLNVRETFGEIDIYLFDQILKGSFDVNSNILDAGCGGGRNLIYFLRSGYEVFAVDQNPQAIEQVRLLAKALNPILSSENFQVSTVEKMPFQNERFDTVISNAVLHFASDQRHFYQMIEEMWRVLGKGGLFFARLASTIGIEDKIELIEKRRYSLPDGSERFLVDEQFLITATNQLGGIWVEPLKTTNVQNLRCMTTWVLQKGFA